MAQRIIFSKKAQIDLARITDFNDSRNKSDSYSKKLFLRLTKRLKLLLKQPLSGLKTNSPITMLLVWDNYYIFYRVDRTSLEIVSIYHQKENVKR